MPSEEGSPGKRKEMTGGQLEERQRYPAAGAGSTRTELTMAWGLQPAKGRSSCQQSYLLIQPPDDTIWNQHRSRSRGHTSHEAGPRVSAFRLGLAPCSRGSRAPAPPRPAVDKPVHAREGEAGGEEGPGAAVLCSIAKPHMQGQEEGRRSLGTRVSCQHEAAVLGSSFHPDVAKRSATPEQLRGQAVAGCLGFTARGILGAGKASKTTETDRRGPAQDLPPLHVL